MLAVPCKCPRPLVFEADETCTRCGHDVPVRVSMTTKQTALAIAAVMLGQRRPESRLKP